MSIAIFDRADALKKAFAIAKTLRDYFERTAKEETDATFTSLTTLSRIVVNATDNGASAYYEDATDEEQFTVTLVPIPIRYQEAYSLFVDAGDFSGIIPSEFSGDPNEIIEFGPY